MSNQEEVKEDEKLSNNDNDEMSIEQRVSWLRERGVLVETSEERKREQVANFIRQTDHMTMIDEDDDNKISYILVPANTSQPLQELYIHSNEIQKYNKNGGGDILLEHLKTVMKTSTSSGKEQQHDIDVELLKKNSATTLASTSNLLNDVKISDETLYQVASEANFEIFTLVRPIPSNQFIGVNIYLDEVGMLKRLPLNKRATDYAYQAGYNPPPQFFGDVYMGRIEQNGKIKNISISLGMDTSMDAEWLRLAASNNLTYQKEINELTGRKDIMQPNHIGQDGIAKFEDGYSWTQTESELEVIVIVPLNAISKDISVKFHPQTLHVTYKKDMIHINIQLFERIDIDSCTWTLDKAATTDSNGKRIAISMEKLESAFWPRIVD